METLAFFGTHHPCYIGKVLHRIPKKKLKGWCLLGFKKNKYIYIYIREVIDIPTYLGGVFHMFSSYAE